MTEGRKEVKSRTTVGRPQMSRPRAPTTGAGQLLSTGFIISHVRYSYFYLSHAVTYTLSSRAGMVGE